MQKPKRNDPCPCGSGKKFKKCCGFDNVVAFNPTLYKDELDQLHQELIDFSFTYIENELTDQINEYVVVNLIDEEDEETQMIYIELLSIWLILNARQQDGKTVFDYFYAKQQHKIKSPTIKKAFSSWGDAQPSVYKIMSEDTSKSQLELLDLISNQTYTYYFNEEIHYEKDELLIGTLVSYVSTYDFFFSMLNVPKHREDEMLDLIDDLEQHDEDLKDFFPEFLADIISEEEDVELDWLNLKHEHVALLFTNHVLKKGLDEEFIDVVVSFWQMYCERHNPHITKPATYAAALDYFGQVTFLSSADVTQAKIAKEYETSTGTISNHYRKFVDELNDTLEKDSQSYPLNLERDLHNIAKLLEDEDFESEEDVLAFLNQALEDGNISPPSDHPRDIAQQLIFEAQEKQGAAQKRLIHEALEIYPNSPDAYLLLAKHAKSFDEHVNIVLDAVIAGEKDLGEDFINENKGRFWGIVETRPFMRAKAAYAAVLQLESRTEESIEEFEDMLELNPNDNQGIRNSLLIEYIELADYRKAKTLMDSYNDQSANFLFSRALIHYLTNGVTKEGIDLLKIAHDHNPYVIDYLLGEKAIPNEDIQYIGMGDKSEAIVYAQENSHLWVGEEDLLKTFNTQK